MKEIREDRLVCYDKFFLIGVLDVLKEDVSTEERNNIINMLLERGEENARQYKKV